MQAADSSPFSPESGQKLLLEQRRWLQRREEVSVARRRKADLPTKLLIFFDDVKLAFLVKTNLEKENGGNRDGHQMASVSNRDANTTTAFTLARSQPPRTPTIRPECGTQIRETRRIPWGISRPRTPPPQRGRAPRTLWRAPLAGAGPGRRDEVSAARCRKKPRRCFLKGSTFASSPCHGWWFLSSAMLELKHDRPADLTAAILESIMCCSSLSCAAPR